MSAQINFQDNNLVLTIPKSMMDDQVMRRLIEWVEFLKLSEQNSMSADDAWVLSEEVKEKWWTENREKIRKALDDYA